jgi:hypothetical protein
MIGIFEYWMYFTSAFFGFVLLGFLIYLLGNRKSKAGGMKNETYTCGEPFPKVRVYPENFYRAISKNLALGGLRKIHSGKLSDYLLWFVAGLAVILLAVLWL